MRRIGWQWLAASSVLLLALAQAETRPQYGGTLHVAMRAAPTTLDPADDAQDSFGRRSITFLLFDTLVMMDDSGRPKPGLAESWQSSRGDQRWEVRLRQGLKFEDGTPLMAEIAAASLREANPSWNVSISGNSVIIEQEVADPEMLAELALPRNAIAKRDVGRVVGTGPFHVTEWQPGRKLSVAANEEYWRGRPFVDAIEIEMGRGFRDQMTEFELRKADLVEVAPEQSHRFVQDGHSLTSSARVELLALVFTRDASSAQEKALRQAMALSIERGSIRSVLLQGTGEPTGSLLPTWISGYGFVFSTETDLQKARELRAEVRSVPTWMIGYDGNDPLSRLVAERVALNAKDAGLALQPTTGSTTDLRVMRIPLASSDPWISLNEIFRQFGLPAVKKGGSMEDLYSVEQAALASESAIPLFHLPVSYASSSNLKDWKLRLDGSWDLSSAWLENSK
ncbi:MAG: ABC transporter substrate-binding protein [Candidatus Sulfotelmatobacter sp.]